MESDLFSTAGGLNGINLANYFPNQRSLNTVVYTHKRFLNVPKEIEKQEACKTNSKLIEQKYEEKHDKAQQFDSVISNEKLHCQKQCNTKSRTDSVLNQTIRFAKNLVPLVIPPEDCSVPVFYTVQTLKSESKYKKSHKNNVEQNTSCDKFASNSKKKTESYRKEKIMHHVENSIKESSQSSQNTLDEININESLSHTISDLSERKCHKREKRKINNYDSDNPKFLISNSFEALVTELVGTNDGSKIKIHLMNDTDKNIFTTSLQMPIIKAIKECVSELHHNDSDINSELKIVQRIIKCNSEKLDAIMNKVSYIENRLDEVKENIKTFQYSKAKTAKASKLEQLSEDLIQVKEIVEEESKDKSGKEKRKFKDKCAVVTLDLSQKENDDLACGEEIPGPLRTTSSVVKLDRPNRIPAKFCWTEVPSE